MSGTWSNTMRGRRSAPGGRGVALLGTLVVHAVAGGMVFATPPVAAGPRLPVYAVRLVAAPRPEPEQRRAPETVQRQAAPAAAAPAQPRQEALTGAPPPPEPDVEREPAPRSTPDVELAPDVEPSTGSDAATIEIPGADFPFPGYLRNIVAQVYRRWSRPQGNRSLRAEVFFFIRRDGSIMGFQFTQRSGSFAFDLAAQGAVEAAGNSDAFGSLPEEFPADVLPVSFFFDPNTLRETRRP